MSDRDWITRGQAAAIIGCGPGQLRGLIRTGHLRTRPSRGRTRSINADSARALASTWRQTQAATKTRRPGPRPRGHITIEGVVYLDTDTASLVLGVTRKRLSQVVLEGRLPHTIHRGKRWFRRDLIEHLAARRALIGAAGGSSREARRHGLWWPTADTTDAVGGRG